MAALVCVVCEREGFTGDVCPCYHNAITEDIRTTWSKIDAPRDAWGMPIMQPYDGHDVFACNNYSCAQHPESLYGR